MSRISEKDLELLSTGQYIDFSSNAFSYLGGEFLSNENDYIEALIHDSNANFLESGIVNTEDYSVKDDGSIALKQGNILRRMGYDRGRFIVKYNFLRKFAGSYENVLVDVGGNILNRNYNPETDHEGMIKENKYFVQAISPTRQEVRLLPQNINDTKYNDDFYNMQREYKREGSGNAEFVFDVVGDEDPKDSNKLKIQNINETNFQLKSYMKGGTLEIQRAFISSYTPFPTVYTADTPGDRLDEFEDDAGTLQPSFYIAAIQGDQFDTNPYGAEIKEPPYMLNYHFSKMKEFDTVELATESEIPANWIYDYSYNGTTYQLPEASIAYDSNNVDWGNKLKHIRWWSPRAGAEFPIVKTFGEPGIPIRTPVITFRSNSTLPDIATTYTWELTGWDYDSGNSSGQIQGYSPVRHYEQEEGLYSGDVEILTEASTDTVNYATVTDPAFPLRATFEYDPLTNPKGCSLAVKLYSGYFRLGVMLTISQPTGITKTIHYPCTVTTYWTEN